MIECTHLNKLLGTKKLLVLARFLVSLIYKSFVIEYKILNLNSEYTKRTKPNWCFDLIKKKNHYRAML